MKLIFLTLIAVVIAIPAYARRGGGFRQQHPRRAEVNMRERNQARRIRQGVRSGSLTSDEAKSLRRNEVGMKRQERAEVKANGGYLTRGQKKQLNQELNQESKNIYQEKHDGETQQQ